MEENFNKLIAQQEERRAQIFAVLVFPTIVYALLYTLLLYDNFHSITFPV